MNKKEAQRECEEHYTLIDGNYLMDDVKVKVLKVEPTSTSKEDVFDSTVTCEWIDPKDNNIKYKHFGLDQFLDKAKVAD